MPQKPFQFPQPPTLDLSIVIVSFNTRPILLDCLESVHAHTRDIGFEIVVVDNHSSDGSAEAVRERFPNVTVIHNRENRGFSAANNQAIRVSRGRLIVLLNSDTLLRENSFLKIFDYMNAHPEFSILGPLIVDDNSQPLPMRLWGDRPRDAALKILGIYDPRDELKKMRPFEPREVEVISGCCFALRRELFESVGLMDENYFLYNEEDDLCRRARNHGHKICFYPDTSIVHLQGKSTHQPDIRKKVILETYRSNLYFYSRYYSPAWNFILRSLYCLSFAAGIARSLWKRMTQASKLAEDDSIALKLKLLLMKTPKIKGATKNYFGP